MFEKLGLEKIQYDVPEFHLAFIHKSFDNKHNNERLEFLGDAILETVISELLFKKFGDANEGLLTRMRSTLVGTENLNLICREYELHTGLKMSKGTLNLPDTHKDKIYAGLVEAVIGSVFVIEGYQRAKQLIEKLFINQLEGLEALRMQRPFCKNIAKVSTPEKHFGALRILSASVDLSGLIYYVRSTCLES